MLKEGDEAPRFALESDGGEVVKLSDFAGKKLVLYFYPKDNTPGCTREAKAFSEASARIAKAGASVVGVSKDSVKSHCSFRDKHALKTPLLSDPDLTVHKAFGVWGEKVMYGKKVQGTIRTTFVIGPDGRIAKVFPSVKVEGHAEQVLAALSGHDGEPGGVPQTPPIGHDEGANKAAAKAGAKKK